MYIVGDDQPAPVALLEHLERVIAPDRQRVAFHGLLPFPLGVGRGDGDGVGEKADGPLGPAAQASGREPLVGEQLLQVAHDRFAPVHRRAESVGPVRIVGVQRRQRSGIAPREALAELRQYVADFGLLPVRVVHVRPPFPFLSVAARILTARGAGLCWDAG